jgi:transketolase
MRNRFADTFYELGKDDPRLAIVVADISPAGSIAKFRQEFPARFINTGVAEQIMIGMVAGMAQRQLRPFAYTIATFALYRPFEFVRDDLCYQNLPVTIVGIGGGVTYSTLGATHHAQEDVAIASMLPNMSVVAPCDPGEVEAATRWCANQTRGPVYLRLGKAGEPDFTKEAPEPWVFGKVRMIRPGSEVAILSYGSIMKLAFGVADRFAEQGINPSIYSVHTVKPLDRLRIAEILGTHKRVVVIEECAPNGGLAMNVQQIAWQARASCVLETFTLKDEFIHCYGSHEDLLAAHGLSIASISRQLGLGAA